MNDQGFAEWDPRHVLDRAYFRDGFLEQMEFGSFEPAIGVNRIARWNGSTLPQTPYVGMRLPMVLKSYKFSLNWRLDDRADLQRFEAALCEPDPALYIPGMYVWDTFQAVSGNRYTLPRARASLLGIVGIDESTAPTEFFVDDVVALEADCVTFLDAQIFDATVTGKIRIGYMAAFKVAVTAFPENMEDVNVLSSAIQLTEDLVMGNTE